MTTEHNPEYVDRTFKLFEHMKVNGPFHFGIVRNPIDNNFSVAYEFGAESEDSPLYGGAAYGIGDTLGEALEMVYKDIGIMDK